MTAAIAALFASLYAGFLPRTASSFASPQHTPRTQPSHRRPRVAVAARLDDGGGDTEHGDDSARTRRSFLRQGLIATPTAITTITASAGGGNGVASAALGTLPELSETNAILQSLTVDVADKNQYDETIAFFTNAFDGMKVMREDDGKSGGVKNVWLGFGPETLSVPPSFTLPVSSLSQYGGHASLHLRYDPSSTTPLYKRSPGEFNNEPPSGDNVAYLQMGVPQYRISQMTKYGGNVLDAYGWVNVVSPAGLPVRGIVGVRPDPMMFLAVNCDDMGSSEGFYAKLGFVRQEYPYARLNQGQGQFEPPQPPGSVYVAPSPNSMGILLLQNSARRKKKNPMVPNPALRSLNVVYALVDGGSDDMEISPGPQLMDPSLIPISFVPQNYLEKEIRLTSIPGLS